MPEELAGELHGEGTNFTLHHGSVSVQFIETVVNVNVYIAYMYECTYTSMKYDKCSVLNLIHSFII